MAQVTLKINGYAYPTGCEDGQETHLLAMAGEVEERIRGIKALGVKSGESFLLAMAAVMMADELHDMKAELAALRATPLESPPPKPAKPSRSEAEAARRMQKLAARAEAIADGLERA